MTHDFLGEADNPLAMAMHGGRGMPPPFGRPMAARVGGSGGREGLVVFPIDDGREKRAAASPTHLVLSSAAASLSHYLAHAVRSLQQDVEVQ